MKNVKKLKFLIDSVEKTFLVNTPKLNIIKNDIMRENYDIIVYPSIGMHPWSFVFSNFRLAPIQITTWGHSVTSGINTVDYYISIS